MIKAIIVDDEYNCRNNLELIVNDFCENVTIVGQAESAQEARELLEKENPDLVFLDIAMPEEDGFSFLGSLKKKDFAVIFTTAHNEYALKAFKANAIDYLEKPINIDDLQNAVLKASKVLENKPENERNIDDLIEKAMSYRDATKISIPTRDGYVVVDESEIIHLEASDNYTMIYLTQGRKHLSSKNIKVYETNLSNTRFFRTHKSHIINLNDHLKEFSRSNGNVAVLTDGITVPISRRKLSDFVGKINTF